MALQAQVITGKVISPEGPLSGATVRYKGSITGTNSSANGSFILRSKKKDKDKEKDTDRGKQSTATIVISHIGYQPAFIPITFAGADTFSLGIITLSSQAAEVGSVDVNAKRDQSLREAGMTTLDPTLATKIPSPFGDFNRILATLPGVVANNELSSQYTVRGGNFDENLVYVNDIEIYKPFLVKNGQQEGLSFINPDMVDKVEFSSGGWQAKYGDKLSSVLNVRYKTPTANKGSVTLGLLTQSAHAELASKNARLSFVGGIRRKSAQYLLQRTFLTRGFDVQGQYKPRFVDYQGYLNYKLVIPADGKRLKKFDIGWLSAVADNLYKVTPEEQQTDFGTISGVLRLNVAFEGREVLKYTTIQNGLNFKADWGRFRSDLAISYVHTFEQERNDLEGGYRLCDVQNDPSKDNFNKCILTRGAGTNYVFARNYLEADIISGLNRNYLDIDSSMRLEFGVGISHERIRDKIYEYSFIDSADYISSETPVDTRLTTSSNRLQAYVQNTQKLGRQTITYGVRLNYWSLTNQVLISPRVQWARRMTEDGRWILKASAGLYQQPAFYRELRERDGTLVKTTKAQKSYHFVAGSDYSIKIWDRPFRFVSEAYYKALPSIIPYDVDNVRLRYLPSIKGKAYAYGADLRLSGEFIKGTESWFSLSYLSTKENIEGDSLTDEITKAKSPRGYLRRPSDQRVTLGVFFQDYLPNNPTFRVYLNTIIGTGLPFGPPGNINYRAALRGPTYRRIDIGFSKVIGLGDKSTTMGRYFETIWIGVDVLNLVGSNNTVSYTWIKDFNANQFAIPNYLSARFFNLKVRADF